MYREHTVAVVVPAYNEEGFVGEVIETVPAYVDRVYAVDDCSTDGTWAEINRHAAPRPDESAVDGPTPEPESDMEPVPVARSDGGERSLAVETDGAASAGDPIVVPIRHTNNRGVGAAITTGYKRALADDIDVTAVMAGDGQMDPDQLDRLLDPIVEGRAAYAKGNRLRGRDYYESMTTFRFGGNLLLSALTKIASGYWRMLDPQNGYTAISAGALEAIDLDDLYPQYGFSNDLLVVLNANGFPIADVRMPAVYGDERSHISLQSFVPRLSWLLWRRFVHRLGVRYVLRDFHPLVGLYAVGVTGLLVGVGSLVSRLRSGRTATADPATPEPSGRQPVSTDGGQATEPATARGTDRSIVGITGLWLLCSTIALLLGMAFDHDANEGLVVVDE